MSAVNEYSMQIIAGVEQSPQGPVLSSMAVLALNGDRLGMRSIRRTVTDAELSDFYKLSDGRLIWECEQVVTVDQWAEIYTKQLAYHYGVTP